MNKWDGKIIHDTSRTTTDLVDVRRCQICDEEMNVSMYDTRIICARCKRYLRMVVEDYENRCNAVVKPMGDMDE